MSARPQLASQNRAASGVILVVLTLLSWASVPLFLRYFAAYIDGWSANGWRYGISAVFWIPVLVVGVFRGSLPRGLWAAAIVPSLFNCAGQSLFAWTPYFIEPGFMTFLLRFHIVFVTFGAYLLFPSERPILRAPRFWVGLMVVFLGATGVLFLGAEPPRGATALGIFLGLSSGALFAGYALAVRYYMHTTHPIVAFAAISLYTAVALVVAMLLLGSRSGLVVAELSGKQLALLVASAFIGIAFSHAMYYAGIVRLGVAIASGIILMQPIITSIASYFLFDERLTAAQWTCGLASLVGAGVLLSAQARLAKGAAAVDMRPGPADNPEPVRTGVILGERR